MFFRNFWSKEASELQQKVIEADRKIIGSFTKEDIPQAIVHIRQDLVLIYSNLESLNKQIRTIKNLLLIITILFVYLIYNSQ